MEPCGHGGAREEQAGLSFHLDLPASPVAICGNAAGYPGNGLGLAIVQAIVESHGGRVRAENTAQGTRFTLRLPA